MTKFSTLVLGVVALVLAGCSSDGAPKDAAGGAAPAGRPAAGSPQTPANATAQAPAPAPAQASGGQGGIAPMTSNVGPMTPVAGAESVGGAGMGGVGNAAKGMAKGVANGPTSSLDQAGGE